MIQQSHICKIMPRTKFLSKIRSLSSLFKKILSTIYIHLYANQYLSLFYNLSFSISSKIQNINQVFFQLILYFWFFKTKVSIYFKHIICCQLWCEYFTKVFIYIFINFLIVLNILNSNLFEFFGYQQLSPKSFILLHLF